ncbi:MAG: trehalose-6-phosphate synthase [Candidatus Omnitrophica bacterium]|nr:trehalose-6-phosphate synthase [Candidatus Omnitrophota bacterium]
MASNKEPYMHEYKGKDIKCIKTVSGLTIALDPVMEAAGGIWIAWASGNADKDTVDENNCVKVPPDNPRYTLKRLWLSKEEEEGYYYGYSNQAIWPLSHIAYEKPIFLKEHWQIYKKVNQYFARAVLEEIGNDKAFVWLQDYHLTLAAKYIKEQRPDAIVAMFWHIPWPNPEAFRICPHKKEILAGLLSCDLLGFHIRYHCINFMDTVDFELEAKTDYEENSVIYRDHKTLIRPFPIGVDFEGISQNAKSQEVKSAIDNLTSQIPPPYEVLALSVDRVDYTKGILERLKAVDRFLQKYPEYQKRFVFYQVGALSRIHIQTYKDLINKVQELAEEINWKYKSGNWYPIVLNNKGIDYEQHLALYRSADLCIVSSLHDGMNLVAKEYVAANVDLKGTLVLSQFTGSARELSKGAILINPYDFDSTADAIKKAIQMPREEKVERMRRLRNNIAERNIYRWAGKVISNLARL